MYDTFHDLVQGYQRALSGAMVRVRWQELRVMLDISGLWTYDIRRTLACYLSNELHRDDVTIRAILNHHDGSALGHYLFKSFDSLCKPIQHYADWLWGLSGAHPLPPPAALSSDARRLRTLSEREREVLSHIASGDSCRRIAAQLGISHRTVDTYRTRLLDKLQLTNTVQLIRYAFEQEGEDTVSVPDQTPPRPVMAPVVMERLVMPGPVQTVHMSRWGLEREEWPG